MTAPKDLAGDVLGLKELKWRRSKSTGGLFLNRGKRAVGAIFERTDGSAYSWRAPGQSQDSEVYATEEDAIEALYAALGLAA